MKAFKEIFQLSIYIYTLPVKAMFKFIQKNYKYLVQTNMKIGYCMTKID